MDRAKSSSPAASSGAALDHIEIVPPSSGEHFPQNGYWVSESDVGSQVLSEAASRDWDGTLRWLREHPENAVNFHSLGGALGKRLTADFTATLRSVANSDVPGLNDALRYALSIDGYEQRDRISFWLDQQPASDFTRSVRGSLLEAITDKAPDTALDYLDRVPDLPEDRKLIEDGSRNLLNGRNAMNRFEDFLANASPKMRPYLIEAALSGYEGIGADAPRWADRIAELPADRQGKAIAGLARTWAGADPQAAIQWALAQPDPANRDAALNASAKTWAAGDLREAAAWINAQPVGINRDVATRGLVAGIAHSQPESAWTWALSIQTPAQKVGALQSAYAGLRNKDFGMAEQLLQSAHLPPADAKTVRQPPPR